METLKRGWLGLRPRAEAEIAAMQSGQLTNSQAIGMLNAAPELISSAEAQRQYQAATAPIVDNMTASKALAMRW